jgi:hypothetical protein
MSREIQIVYHYSGSPVLYGCLFVPSTGKVWCSGQAAFETWGTGSRDADDYDLTITHRGGSLWTCDFPTGPGAALYRFITYLQSGDSPANGDYPVARDVKRWTGSQWAGSIIYVRSVPA